MMLKGEADGIDSNFDRHQWRTQDSLSGRKLLITINDTYERKKQKKAASADVSRDSEV